MAKFKKFVTATKQVALVSLSAWFCQCNTVSSSDTSSGPLPIGLKDWIQKTPSQGDTVAASTAFSGGSPSLQIKNQRIAWNYGAAILEPSTGGSASPPDTLVNDSALGIALGGEKIYFPQLTVSSRQYGGDTAIMMQIDPVSKKSSPLNGTKRNVPSQPVTLAEDAAVYWITNSSHNDAATTIVKSPLDGGAETAIALSGPAMRIRSDETYVYWMDYGAFSGGNSGVWRLPKTFSGSPQLILSADEMTAAGKSVHAQTGNLWVDGENIYASTRGEYFSGGQVKTADGTIFRKRKDGSGPVALMATLSRTAIETLCGDQNYLYLGFGTNSSRGIDALPKNAKAGSPVNVASSVIGAMDCTVSNQKLYWITGHGDVFVVH